MKNRAFDRIADWIAFAILLLITFATIVGFLEP